MAWKWRKSISFFLRHGSSHNNQIGLCENYVQVAYSQFMHALESTSTNPHWKQKERCDFIVSSRTSLANQKRSKQKDLIKKKLRYSITLNGAQSASVSRVSRSSWYQAPLDANKTPQKIQHKKLKLFGSSYSDHDHADEKAHSKHISRLLHQPHCAGHRFFFWTVVQTQQQTRAKTDRLRYA